MAAAKAFHSSSSSGAPRNSMEALLVAEGAVQYEATVEVWPENWPVWRLYQRVCTQWRHSWGGPAGLDYTAIYPFIDRMNLSPDDWDQVMSDLQVIEVTARDAMRGKNGQ